MKKNKYKIKKDDIELIFQHISKLIHDKKWWKDEKKRLKAIKIYKKLNIEELFNLSKEGKAKHRSHFLSRLSDWCKRCVNSKQWKKLKNSIHQAQHQTIEAEQEKETGQEKKLSLSNKAQELLHKVAKQENLSISELIISILEHKKADLIVTTNDNKATQTIDNKQIQTIEKTDNNEFNELESVTYKKIKKGNQFIIELWHYAGGQCQALSKATQKRCKRITPDLSMKQQKIGNIVYEFSVCHTHNKESSQLDPGYINHNS